MTPWDILTDVKVWVLLGIVLGLTLGFEHPDTSTMLMVVLMVQMTFSLEGLRFSAREVRRCFRGAMASLLFCFVLNTGLTIMAGTFFLGSEDLWYGWVMLAATPCAISVMVCALTMGGDARMTAVAVAVIYVAALALTPVISLVLLGEAADPLVVLRYIVLFIAVPFVLRVPLSRLHPPAKVKMGVINVMMMLLVMMGIGSNRDYMMSQPDVVGTIVVFCILRTFCIHIPLMMILRKAGVPREDAMVYGPMAVWKNSGMSVAMVMAMFGATHPGAVLPCVISLGVECVWFACASRYTSALWPMDGEKGRRIPGDIKDRHRWEGHDTFDASPLRPGGT